MKGILKWFKNEAKMKRWYILILIGIALASYGMVNLLIGKELQIKDLAKIIISFVVGFSLVVLSIIFIQKRTLELFVQETDNRDEAKDGKVKYDIPYKEIEDNENGNAFNGIGTYVSIFKNFHRRTFSSS